MEKDLDLSKVPPECFWAVFGKCHLPVPCGRGHGWLVFLHWGPLVHQQLPGHSEAVVVEPEAVQLPEPGAALLVAHSLLTCEIVPDVPGGQLGMHMANRFKNPRGP